MYTNGERAGYIYSTYVPIPFELLRELAEQDLLEIEGARKNRSNYNMVGMALGEFDFHYEDLRPAYKHYPGLMLAIPQKSPYYRVINKKGEVENTPLGNLYARQLTMFFVDSVFAPEILRKNIPENLDKYINNMTLYHYCRRYSEDGMLEADDLILGRYLMNVLGIWGGLRGLAEKVYHEGWTLPDYI